MMQTFLVTFNVLVYNSNLCRVIPSCDTEADETNTGFNKIST